ncbi:MAG: hypothetical protein JWN60_1539 [Acidobacteria bacterium]|jgi:hypothetical protein|nr:hypothetical protein [Acidobacteriota bacterium]
MRNEINHRNSAFGIYQSLFLSYTTKSLLGDFQKVYKQSRLDEDFYSRKSFY